MQQVPEWYIDAMRQDSRLLRCVIRLYVDSIDNGNLLLIYDDDIADFNATRELLDVGVPCAYIGQNVGTIKLYNWNKRYMLDAEYKRFIARGVKVVISIDTKSDEESTLWFGATVFTGWIDSYEYDDLGEFLTITAYDSLHFLKNHPSPWFRPTDATEYYMPLCDFLEYYFKRCNLHPVYNIAQDIIQWHNGYRVDPNLVYKAKLIYAAGSTVGDVLTSIAKLGICAIFCDANDVLTVQLLPKTRHLVYTFDDLTQVFSSSSSSNGYSNYTHVAVKVYDAFSSANENEAATCHVAYDEDGRLFPAGATELNDLELNGSFRPAVVRLLTTSRLSKQDADIPLTISNTATMPSYGLSHYIRMHDYTIDKMSLDIYALSASEADLAVYSFETGRIAGSVVEAQDPNYKDSFFLMKNILEINNELIIDKAYAKQVASTYAKMLTESAQVISCSVRGEPSIELLDLVAIVNPQAVHDSEQVLITRLNYSYNGSLSCDMETIRYSAIVMLTYAFIAPGMYIPYDTGATYITAHCEPVEAGIVDGTGAYAIGDTMRLSTLAFVGYSIDHWEDAFGNIISRTPALILTVQEAATYIAVMKEDKVYTSFTMEVEAGETVELPPISLSDVNGTISWGDGTIEAYDAADEAEHTYDVDGTFLISLQAPIEKLAYEIFANEPRIRSFTAGNDIQYIPNGMFYNSGVENVNLLKANISYVGDQSAHITKYELSTVNISNETYDRGLNTNYTIVLRPNSSGSVIVPKYYNNRLVVGYNVTAAPYNYSGPTGTLDFKHTPHLTIVNYAYDDYARYTSFIGLESISNDRYSDFAMTHFTGSRNTYLSGPVNIPNGIIYLRCGGSASNKGKVGICINSNINKLYLPNTVNYIDIGTSSYSYDRFPVKDIYIAADTEAIQLNGPQRSTVKVNVYISKNTELYNTVPNTTNIIYYEDEEDNNG